MRVGTYVYALVAGWVAYRRVYRRLTEFVRGYVGSTIMHDIFVIRSHTPPMVSAHFVVFAYRLKLAGGMEEEYYERPVEFLGDLSKYGGAEKCRRRVEQVRDQVLDGAYGKTDGVYIALSGVKLMTGVEHLLCDRSIRIGNRYIDVWKLIQGDAVVNLAVVDKPRRKVDKAIWWNASST